MIRFVASMLLTISFVTSAQQNKAQKPVPKLSAKKYVVQLCDCVEGIMAGYHPDLLLFLQEMNQLGEGEASARLEKKVRDMAQEEQVRLGKDVIRIQNIEASLKERCNSVVEIEEKTRSDKKFQEKTLALLKKSTHCSMTYQLMLLGLKNK